MSWVPYRLVGVGVAGIERGDDGRDWDGEGERMVDERDELSCAMLSKWNLSVSLHAIRNDFSKGAKGKGESAIEGTGTYFVAAHKSVLAAPSSTIPRISTT